MTAYDLFDRFTIANDGTRVGEWLSANLSAGELEALIRAEVRGRRIVLDLKDLTLVDEGAVSFLRRCEAESIQLKNCPAYIREWITGELDADEEN